MSTEREKYYGRVLQKTMAGDFISVDDDLVHEDGPLGLIVEHRKLRLVGNVRPVRIDLADGEDTTVGHAKVRTSK